MDTPDIYKNDLVTKTITDAAATVVARLRSQALTPTSLLFPFLDKMIITSGRSLYPFVDIIKDDDTEFKLGAIELAKTNDFTIAEVTQETREDATPTIGMDAAVQTILDIQMVKRIEKKIVEALVADTNVHHTMTLNWSGIKDGILAMGGEVFSIAGTIYVAVNLSKYLEIIEQDDFKNSMSVLKDRVKLVVMEQFSDNQLLVMHEHGAAGGLRAKELELDPQPGLDRIDYVAPFTYSFGWDSKYVKFSN